MNPIESSSWLLHTQTSTITEALHALALLLSGRAQKCNRISAKKSIMISISIPIFCVS